jgi:Kdo2-lipid IVA lauroyltransferase/acyltransferase
MKKIKYLIEFLAVIAILPVLTLIPYKLRLKVGAYLGLIIYYIYIKRREIAFTNISESFPDLSQVQNERICRESFRHFGMSVMEFIQLRRFNKRFIDKYISIVGEEYIQKALAQNKGLVGICPHLGNWEYVAAYIAGRGYPVSVIMKRQSNRYVNNLIEKLRMSFGMELIYKSKAGFPVLRALKKNRIVAFVADQDAGRNGIFVNFMGRPASTAQGPARFALSSNSSAIIFTGVREKDGKIKIIISPPLNFDYNKENKSAVYHNTGKWTKAIEEYIKQYPEQYFWMHRRWKTRE